MGVSGGQSAVGKRRIEKKTFFSRSELGNINEEQEWMGRRVGGWSGARLYVRLLGERQQC